MTPPQTIAGIAPGVPSANAKSQNKQMNELLTKRWARLFVPSLSDLFFLATLCWMFMGAQGWTGLLADADVGWHIRTGEYILNHHAVPHHDLYSFSKPGAPWFAWEWLSDLIDAVVFRIGGLKGVVLTAGVIIAIFATTLIRRITRLGVNLFAALLIALLGVGSASMHFLARPHIYTLLLLSVSMWLVETDRDGSAPSKRIFWLIPLTIVWTNLHGGFLAIVAVLGLTAAGSAIEAWIAAREKTVGQKPASGEQEKAKPVSFLSTIRSANWTNTLRYAILTAACAAVSLVNPYGWGLHQHIIDYLQSDWIRNVIQEFQSPTFRSENMLQFEALLFVGLMASGALFRRKRVAEGMWILFFAYLSLSSVRHVPVFVAVTLPLLAAEVASWWQSFTQHASPGSLPGILNQMAADSVSGFRRSSAWPALFVLALVIIGKPIPWPTDFPKLLFPVDMVRAHEAEIVQARLLTTDQWGDYLIFRNPERQKVFVDGRSDFYGADLGNRVHPPHERRMGMGAYAAQIPFQPRAASGGSGARAIAEKESGLARRARRRKAHPVRSQGRRARAERRAKRCGRRRKRERSVTKVLRSMGLEWPRANEKHRSGRKR